MLKIDYREPADIIAAVQKEAKKRKISTSVEQLPCGDFVWEDTGICIERKTVADFAMSWKDERIKHQLMRMAGFPHPYVFISGPIQDCIIYGRDKPWVWTISRHDLAKLSVSSKYNVKVIQVLNDMKLIDAVFDIKDYYDDFAQNGIGYALIKQIRKSDVIDPNYVMFMTIPGIGKKKAKDLMERYKKFTEFLSDYKSIKLPKSSIEFLEKII